jgi:hypothetical protein
MKTIEELFEKDKLNYKTAPLPALLAMDGRKTSTHVLYASRGVDTGSQEENWSQNGSLSVGRIFLQSLLNIRNRIDQLLGNDFPLAERAGPVQGRITELEAPAPAAATPDHNTQAGHASAPAGAVAATPDHNTQAGPAPAAAAAATADQSTEPTSAAAVTPVGTERGRAADSNDSGPPPKKPRIS